MKEFIKKWNDDPRFQTKIKLSLYTLFVICVSIFAVSSRNNTPTNQLKEQYQNQVEEEDNNNDIIEIPNEYNYIINITINEKNYQYTGTKNNIKETIIKEVDSITTNYIYENNNYYKEIDIENYILTTKEEVYDVVDYNYLKLETINEYISKSTKEANKYLVYLKDIILGNDSEKYITIIKEENKIKVDYTELMRNFDKTIDNYLIIIEIEE